MWKSAAWDADEEACVRLAMELDAQFNNENVNQGTTRPLRAPQDYDADLAFAMQLQSEINLHHDNPSLSSPFDQVESEMDPLLPQSGSLAGVSLRGGGGDDFKPGRPAREEQQSRRRTAMTTMSSTPRTFATYQEFVQYLLSIRCHKCSTSLVREKNDVEGLFQEWLSGHGVISSIINCKKCSATTCVGCGSAAGKSAGTTRSVQGKTVQWCCSRGRTFLIWTILCGLDQHYCASKQREAAKTGTRRVGDYSRGVGYGGGFGGMNSYWDDSGDGYFASPFSRQYGSYRNHAADAGKAKAQTAQLVSDSFNQVIFAFLEELLPSLDRATNFDMNPPDCITSMLLNSKILDRAAELLRNDSLDDIAKRKSLYQALIGFLRIIGTHPLIASKTVFTERSLRPDTVNLLALSFQGDSNTKDEKVSSLGDGIRNLNIQSNMMLKGAQRNQNEFHTNEGQDLLWLCRQISDLSEFLLKNTVEGTGASTSTKLQDHGITEVQDQQLFASHCYASAAQSMNQSARGRIKRLITELTTLQTGLPPGIFVKYATSRIDMMKILIVGPSDTPYENGLFEFDLLCGTQYPYEPPGVQFKGTAGGTVSFNPNLHPDGKVCLSLLGTWSGEPWKPAESTILQVLVSIQAMILCEHPIGNEPDEENLRGTPLSQRYDQLVRRLTVRYAMLNWLESPNQPNVQLWKDIILAHFKGRADRILQTVSRWEREDGNGPVHASRHMALPLGMARHIEGLSTLRPTLRGAFQSIGANVYGGGDAGTQQSSGNAYQGYGNSGYGSSGYGSQHGRRH
ncbi:hypothetical protein EJ04DRAFT_549960 [Polyplosphaeria fusca]|uniref:UBC core domain-containing protein n=1 Tax=Polyplosphaeria fusca TaxID=682080 RepID=A0A9P4R5H7_9PLEO|nr:hypothetical protein EJ04DRAFT_549960 [Polyplosphaeria fusca]